MLLVTLYVLYHSCVVSDIDPGICKSTGDVPLTEACMRHRHDGMISFLSRYAPLQVVKNMSTKLYTKRHDVLRYVNVTSNLIPTNRMLPEVDFK